ncbi:hypothetical protein GGF42_002999 [Coemansia sp. RSA 2424]|nr:hypothetical protein GGF42_002999 [Coemansia sp. RSA 2424]
MELSDARRCTSPAPLHREHQSPPLLDLDPKRQRVSRACDRCRRKKTKCDAKHPVCSHCLAISASCTYLDAAKKRGPPKGYIDVIENRLHKVEELLSSLVLSDSAAARHVLVALRAHGSEDLAAVTDSSGMLFGAVTLSELELRAAQSPARIPPCSSPQPEQPQSRRNRRATECQPAESSNMDDRAPTPATANVGTAHQRTDQPPSSDAADNDCAEHLTRLERGVGHLTLDPTGSLRYLGDSSGWDIINRNLISSAASPRLTRGINGAFRWPPISSIPMREAEEEDAGRAADVEPTVTAHPVEGDYGHRPHPPSSGHDAPSTSANGSEDHANSGTTGIGISDPPANPSGQDRVVPVPHNMPLSGKPPMPDAEEEARLLALYFRYVHPVFPILYKSYFLERVLAKDNRPSPSLLSAVFAAASTYKFRESQSETDLARARIQMAVHFQRAKLYLDEQYTLNTTASILTLLLMAVYEQGTMSTRSWLYSGMAIRKAYDLGLHRDVGATKYQGYSVLSRTEVEVRQRAWWGCYILDIMVSATLGRPTTIRDFTFDVPFPANYGEDSDDLLIMSSMNATDPASLPDSARTDRAQEPQQALGQELAAVSAPRTLSDHATPALARDARTSIAVAERMVDYVSLAVGEADPDELDNNGASDEFGERRPQEGKSLGVYYLDILHILSHILTEMYACKPNRAYVAKFCVHDLHSRVERLIVLDHELRQWKLSLPPCLLYPVDDILAIKPARCVYISLIHLVYYTAMILLHRPFISRLGEPLHVADIDHGSSPGASSSGSHSAPHPSSTSPLPSHSICTVSAQMTSLIGQAIVQDSRVFIMPFITFMMFTAGTMHLNNVIVAADSWLARRFLKRTLDVMSRLGAHWQVSSKCHSMLSALVRTNGIGLDQVMDENDDDEMGAQAIKDRCRETSRIAYAVYENRAMYRERGSVPATRSSMTDSDPALRSSHDAPKSTDPASLPNRNPIARPSILSDGTHGTSHYSAPAASLAAAVGSWSESTIARQNDPAEAVFGPTQQSRSERAPKTVATQLFLLRNKIDSDGLPIVPASPYTSVDFSREAMSSAGLLRAGPPSTAATLGQFVPSLEFFANADFPLGLGGPNGQASLDLPLAVANRDSGQYLHPSATPTLSALTRMPVSAGQATTGPTSSAACASNIADSYGSSGGISDLFAASLLGAQCSTANAFSASILGTDGGFGTNEASSSGLSSVAFAGPSYNPGLGGLDSFSPLAWDPQSASMAPPVSQAGETPWKDYVSQVIRMFNADHCMPDSNLQ